MVTLNVMLDRKLAVEQGVWVDGEKKLATRMEFGCVAPGRPRVKLFLSDGNVLDEECSESRVELERLSFVDAPGLGCRIVVDGHTVEDVSALAVKAGVWDPDEVTLTLR